MSHSVIIVDDDEAITQAFGKILERAGYRVRTFTTVRDFMVYMETDTPEVVLMDVHLPDRRGEDVVPELLARDPFLRVIVITGDQSIQTAIHATRQGAWEYLTKPFSANQLLHVVGRALEHRSQQIAESAEQRNPVAQLARERRLVGESASIRSISRMIERVARTPNTPVLITGESGTGKEVAAESIHNLSERRNRPLIKVNCSAIPMSLVESELFGHERGAFTDAKETRKGLFELADGGTIFLDEIGELDASVQPKLLRVLEDHTVSRVGSDKPRHVDIRVIAATNRNLEDQCAEGNFREDLYFRLAVMQIHMPPLRDQREDIMPLANQILVEKSLELGKKITGFSQDVVNFFLTYAWPGNVRELRNMVERLIILADTNRIELDRESLRRYCFQGVESTATITAIAPAAAPPPMIASVEGDVLPLEELEKRALQNALRKLRFNKTATAQKLGISRSTLLRKIAHYGLETWIDEEQKRERA